MAPTRAAPPGLKPASFFLLRTPHLPVDVLYDWARDLAGPKLPRDAEDGAVAAALAQDAALLERRLAALLERPEILEALHIASPSLLEGLQKTRAGPKSKAQEQALWAVTRYLSRMAGRATPFGLFAAFSAGTLGSQTALEVDAGGHRHVRLDMEKLVLASEAIARTPGGRARLRFRANRAIYAVEHRLYYPELRSQRRRRLYNLAEVERDEALDLALGAARSWARRDDIAGVLVGGEITLEDARTYVDELIDQNLLECELAPPVMGDDPLTAVLQTLEAALAPEGVEDPAVLAGRDALRDVQAKLSRLDAQPLGVEPTAYAEVVSRLEPLLGEVRPANVLQVDMSRDARATLSDGDAKAIARGVLALSAFSPRLTPLEGFVRAFQARYEGRAVPLLEALDDQHGLGFLHPMEGTGVYAPLVRGLPLSSRRGPGPPEPWPERTQFLAQRLEQSWRTGREVLTLEPAEVAAFDQDPAKLPPALAALVSVLAPLRPGGPRRFWLHGFFGESVAKFFGRFCAWSPELTAQVRALLREEEAAQPEAVFAEIVHQPVAPRIGNILLRPLLRDHEIPFCGRSTAPEGNAIPLTDLTVQLKEGRVLLKSVRLGREIVPRLSNAHSHSTVGNLALYRFLGALQAQGTLTYGGWSWDPFGQAESLPRVEIGNVILAPRCWFLDQATLAGLCVPSAIERARASARLRDARALPRVVGLVDGDNVLPVDFDNVLSRDAFTAIVRRRTSVKLIELFFEPEALLARGPAGRYTHELVLPFLRNAAASPQPDRVGAAIVLEAAAPALAPAPRRPKLARLFPPGSAWLFAKIYCASTQIDRLLAGPVRSVLGAVRGGAVDRWFFIRYSDPDVHLRLRFHGAPDALAGQVLPALEAALASELASGLLARVELASYQRELERYGGDAGMELCEALFDADSEAALGLVALLGGPAASAEADRWRWALYGTHRLLVDFGLDLPARQRLVSGQRRFYGNEAGLPPEGEHALGERYRIQRASLETLLAEGDPRVQTIFAARSSQVSPIAAELRARRAELGVGESNLLGSLLHMWNNRLLRTQARLHELVIHSYLTRLYTSQLARQGN